ncbi:MAG: NAD-binding protein [Cyanobacteria bacterium REEB67]|nr:NAD-binding protein [Cyanobacteria bacterium REEB67]
MFFQRYFFVSIGILLDPLFIWQHWLQVAIFVFFLIAGKAAIGTFAALFATRNLRSAILVGLCLTQIGEFPFVLLTMGHDLNLISMAIYNLVFAGSVITKMATPAIMALAPKILARRLRNATSENEDLATNTINLLQDHVIVCGFGRIGHNVGLVLETNAVPFVVIELNANIIEELAMRGIRHIYGDSMNPIVWERSKLKQASSDDIDIFKEAGVNAAVQLEFKASIEITHLVLQSLNFPNADVKGALEQNRTRRSAIFQPDIETVNA